MRTVKVLVLNCGSSSVKFQLIETDAGKAAAGAERTLAKGLVENIGGPAVVRYEAEGRRPLRESGEILEHKIAIERCLELLTRKDVGVLGSKQEIGAVGHRVVHGGERFKDSALIDEAVLEGIEECFELAPLHNPPNVKGYRAARELLGELPQAAVFDTSFHQTLPEHAYLYGLPYVLYERHGIRRYGFHGTSHRFVSARLSALLGRADASLRLITCHLGNGCSVTAIRGGRSLDTSMGFTPLEGLVMGSRSGDLDPAILPHVMAKAAVDLFCYRLKKYVAAYVGVLGGVDGLAFAGGIGENAPLVRARALAGMEALGLRLDPERNDAARGVEQEISPKGAQARVFVVPTNEELLIARDTVRLVQSSR